MRRVSNTIAWIKAHFAEPLEIDDLAKRANMSAEAAAYEVGYASPSQFSREYTRLFGLSPRRDAELLRENSTS